MHPEMLTSPASIGLGNVRNIRPGTLVTSSYEV